VTFFADADFEFAAQILIGSAATGGADVGEVLSTIARIPDGDGEA
jgi:hypothetical protein